MTSVALAYLLLVVSGSVVLLYGFVRNGRCLLLWTFTFFPLTLSAAHYRARTWSEVPERLEEALTINCYLLAGALLLALCLQRRTHSRSRPRSGANRLAKR